MMQRREFLKSSVAGWLFLRSPLASALSEVTDITQNKKLVWVMLRGAMDSLHAVVPYFDPDLVRHRASLIEPIRSTSTQLARGFALHPSLVNMAQWYSQGEFLPIVAVASGYRQRSHFDAQDQMESGLNITDHDNGWLARAVKAKHAEGLAISQTVPIAMRGLDSATTWYPSRFAPVEDDLLSRLSALYEDDSQFEQWLEQAINSRNTMGMDQTRSVKVNFDSLAKHCGDLLRQNENAQFAMLELGGWDTHNAQANRLARQFSSLDSGLAELKSALGETWQNTVILVSTEFGRTVAVNGTGGTDHGTASALFMLGGAIKGKRVLGEWPGLATEQLYEQRDLKPTSDIRSWIGAVLQQHCGLSDTQVKNVFPDVVAITESIIV
jgi:uncharacterized protein (DUF1501 family)